MEKAGVISDYLQSLAEALSFDRSLARRVQREVEDHLREAVASAATGDRPEAERRAVASFGDPHVIAAQFATVSLARQTRRAGIAVALVIAAVFAAMKARVAWYALMPPAMSEDARAWSAIIGLVDRYSFWLSMIMGIGGLAYVSRRAIPAALHAGYRQQLRRSVLLCAAATGSLVISVISDGVLTTLRLVGTELCAGSLLPILSMALEVGCAGILVFQIHSTARCGASAAGLLKA